MWTPTKQNFNSHQTSAIQDSYEARCHNLFQTADLFLFETEDVFLGKTTDVTEGIRMHNIVQAYQ